MSKRVLVACEFSGTVRDAFIRGGYDAWSCDLLPTATADKSRHIQGDALQAIAGRSWDLVIAHPPCTYLASSGARWWKDRQQEQADAIAFVLAIWGQNVGQMAIENPIGRLATAWRKADQIIQPWQFGHGEVKATCLWLRGLPLLKPTAIVSGREARIHKMSPSKNRGYLRSVTYSGIAEAMADQWGQA